MDCISSYRSAFRGEKYSKIKPILPTKSLDVLTPIKEWLGSSTVKTAY